MPTLPIKNKPLAMTGSAAGGIGRLEKTAAAPGKNTPMKMGASKRK